MTWERSRSRRRSSRRAAPALWSSGSAPDGAPAEEDEPRGEVARTTLEARRPGRTTAAVREHNGAPDPPRGREAHNGMAYAAYGPTVEVFGDFTRAGVDLFTFSGTPTEAGYGLSKTVWVAPGEFDYSEFDRRVRDAAGGQPAGLLLPAAVPARSGVVERPAPGRHRADGPRRRQPRAARPRGRQAGAQLGLGGVAPRHGRGAAAADRARRRVALCRPRHRLSPRLRHHRGMDDVGRERERVGGLLAGQRPRAFAGGCKPSTARTSGCRRPGPTRP